MSTVHFTLYNVGQHASHLTNFKLQSRKKTL